MKELNLKFHLSDSEYLTALRLVAGAVCSAREVDVDTLEDFKVCVTESAIILRNCGFEKVSVNFDSGEQVVCTLSGEGGKPSNGENELSLALVSALLENCEIIRNGEIIQKLILKI